MYGTLVFGVGIYDIENVTNPKINLQGGESKYYMVWTSMLCRCYNEKSLKRCPTYKDCSVCDDWLRYSVFVAWMEAQDWKDKQLDKDIRVPNNKCYSPETCVFVTKEINLLFKDNSRNTYPMGVSLNWSDKKYLARVYCNGVKKYLGLFESVQEARDAYVVAKAEIIKYETYRVTGPQSELVKDGLMKHIAILLADHSKNK